MLIHDCLAPVMPENTFQVSVGSKNFKQLTSTNLSSAKLTTIQPQSNAFNMAEPYVEIIEEPMSKGQRFRYKCEGRSAGSLPGETSTIERKTFPTICIRNINVNAAIVVVSCVTKDPPYRPHPHNLVGQDCKDGVCTLRVKGSGPIVFSNIGIQCCKRHDIVDSLKTRAKIRVDPFATAGSSTDVNSIDLNAVRLCFQAFLPDANKKFTRVVSPVVSQPIIDKKTVHDLVICRLSRQSGYAQGGDEVFLLCEKVNKDDIQVRFYQETEDGICWEAYGEFTAQDIHRQYAIVFKTPPYKDVGIQSTVQVYIQLRRPSDDDVGDPKPFQYIPNDTDPFGIAGKRKRLSASSSSRIPASVLLDVKGDEDETVSMETISSQNVKMRLKKKAERGLQKKEKIPSSASAVKTEVILPEYSFINTGASFTAAPFTFTTNLPTANTMVYEMALPVGEANTIACNEGVVSFLSMLGAADASSSSIHHLTFAPLTAASGQTMTDGNFAPFLQYPAENSTQLPAGSLVISESLSEIDGSKNMDVSVDGAIGAEECIADSKPAEDVD